ncbi:MAG: peptide chain release factor family protein [Desulfomonilia bacterium]|uniref:Peptide chain release factor 1 n=1 Tax=anaerobic digester metagenome TaxID=1263854 RepID=A0A485M481_9ZZZZ|nr:peptide chain release factor-like protein [Pseudomonadota bacterium]HON38223.1 peptide chain release factor-like protein [Deltaproteobacteria bacterium]HRS56073.1 peptide chain release factor-like protein [Desulfomonilia bacterium]HPD21545.1 peptide chain release factor-like protein [Deltaproteobacteria bacterium]HPX19769.1 peptide chain release factor-like protein [Deltaproteobacteria bacterium]
MSGQFVNPEKVRDLEGRMATLGIREADIQEKFIHARGRGGQKVNKTAACVYLKHLPTGIEVKCQESRSREANRFFARRLLTDKIEDSILGKDSPRAREIEKIRKQKMRRSRRARGKTGAGEKNSEG